MNTFLQLRNYVRIALLGLLVSCGVNGFAQMTVSTIGSAAAVNTLLGAGLTASNINYSGNANQLGSFQCTDCNLNLPSGIVMSSGNATSAVGPNSSGTTSNSIGSSQTPDSDLSQLYAGAKYDLCKLEFDFVPTGDSITFEYVFGSDEYPEYSNNASFNDLFGFFLSGPGINGSFSNNAINIALVPNTSSYVGIQTIKNGTTGVNGPCVNCEYYIHNGNGSQSPYNSSNYYIQPDGFTTVLVAKAAVQCGMTYHIKMAIADNGDSNYNSWVFLKEGSFQSSLPMTFSQSLLAPSANGVYEGCNGGTLALVRPCGISGDLEVNLSYGGSAVFGEDYNELPSTITIPAGQDSAYINFNAFYDDLIEGMETVEITAQFGATVAMLVLNIHDTPPLDVTVADAVVACNQNAVLNLNISGGSGNYTINWEGYGSSNPLTIENPENETIHYTVSDLCIEDPWEDSVTVSLIEYPQLVVDLGGQIETSCNTIVSIEPTVTGGNGSYTYSWSVDGEPQGNATSIDVAGESGMEVVLEVTDGCGTTASGTATFVIEPQVINIDLGPLQVETDCMSPVLFEPEVSGGTGNYSYEWTVNGTVTGNTLTHLVQVNTTSVVGLTVTDECGGYGHTSVTIVISPNPIVISLGQQTVTAGCMEPVQFVPGVSGGVGDYSYEWTVNGAYTGNTTTHLVQVNTNSVVQLTVTDQCGGSATTQVNIVLTSDIAVNIVPSDVDVCPNEEVTLTAEVAGAVGNTSYNWSSGGAASSVVVSSPTTASYTVTVSDACAFSATDTYVMDVWSFEPMTYPGENFEVCVNSGSGNTIRGGMPPYSFEYDQSLITIGGAGDVSGGQAGVTTTVIVTDYCGNTGNFEVNIVSCDVQFPNIFTPNSDPQNAYFVIKGLEHYHGSELEIYNRWGKKIFSSTNYKNDWSGAEQEEGTYFYILRRSDGQEFSGSLQLVR